MPRSVKVGNYEDYHAHVNCVCCCFAIRSSAEKRTRNTRDHAESSSHLSFEYSLRWGGDGEKKQRKGAGKETSEKVGLCAITFNHSQLNG
jgi:hypothetical protein